MPRDRLEPWSTAPDGSRVDRSVRTRSGIDRWWGEDQDQLLGACARTWRWFWDLAALDELRRNPSVGQTTWSKRLPPAAAGRRWEAVLLEWIRLRGDELDVYGLVAPPRVPRCPMCLQPYREDSLPYSAVTRLGAHQIDFCRNCFERAVWAQGSNRMGRRQIAAWLQRLAQVTQLIPSQTYPTAHGDLLGKTTEERLAILQHVVVRPSGERVRRVFGSWFKALVAAGILEHDAQRLSRGTRCLAVDGHVCHSFGEKTIDDLLFADDIPHQREPSYPGTNYRGDFSVNGVVIEYVGLAGDPRYDERLAMKREAAITTGLAVLEVTRADVADRSRLRKKIAKALKVVRTEGRLGAG